jgi:hypothetical protein
MSWSFDVGPNPLPPGHVTGDFITMLAVAWSLVRQQQADAFDMLDCLASSYSPGSPARYSPYNALALEGLSEGEKQHVGVWLAEQMVYAMWQPLQAGVCAVYVQLGVRGVKSCTETLHIFWGMTCSNPACPGERGSSAVPQCISLTYIEP